MATVIFKPTEACNARCVYCDVVHKDHAIAGKMSYEMLEQVFIRINEFLVEYPEEDMEVVWHGGEPLLLGPGYFAKALEFQRKHCLNTQGRVRHTIQSNLTMFTSEFTPVLKGLGIHNFGTSYDPYSPLRGIGESVDAALYKKKFIEGAMRAEKDGFVWGLIYVVTKLSLERPLEIFRHLVNFNPWGSVMLNPVVIREERLSYLKITPEEFTDFLGAIFPYWWKHRHRLPNVQPFRGLTESLRGNQSLSCVDAGVCARTHFNVAPDGRISQCGRASDWRLLDYGSIMEKGFAQVLEDPQRLEFRRRSSILAKTECKECRFWDVCHGGCPLDAWQATGSFMSRSGLCGAKRGFIENYFEPVVYGASAQDRCAAVIKSEKTRTENKRGRAKKPNGPVWINPIGGLGDVLMMSGVLKQAAEADPERKFNLVTRTKYDPMLEGHPAIAHIGHPPAGAEFIRTNYWDDPDYGSDLEGKGTGRAYQLLARIFGLGAPVAETLHVPFGIEPDPLMKDFIPWKKKNVLICPASDSPRKQMALFKWEGLVRMLSADDTLIAQVGKIQDAYVRGTYSLIGLTNPKELIGILSLFDCVVTSDNFIMHAAHLCSVPAVVLWGPTDHRIYGYSGQTHLQSRLACEFKTGCIGPGRGGLYPTPCPEGHCIDTLDLEEIGQAVKDTLKKKKSRTDGRPKDNYGRKRDIPV